MKDTMLSLLMSALFLPLATGQIINREPIINQKLNFLYFEL